MIILQGHNLSRLFGGNVLFDNFTLQIQNTSRIALVGRNGSGKSTLLKILAGIEQASSGEISKTKDLRIGYLDQHSAVDTTNSIWDEMLLVFKDTIALHEKVALLTTQLAQENIWNDKTTYTAILKQYEALQHELETSNGYRYESDIKSMLAGFGFGDMDYSRSISELSGGQKTRLAMAKILLEKHDLLILDEPTNHLDIDTLNWLENYLSHYKGALLIVSHDRFFLDKVTNEVYEISQRKLHHYKGNYTFYLEEKERRTEQLEKAYEQQQATIQKMENFIAKNLVRATTTKRAQSRRKQLEKMDRLEKPKGNEKSANFQFSSEKMSGHVVLQTDKLTVGYDTPLSQNITLNIRKQQAIALVGPNGIGKTTLLKTLVNKLPVLSGLIHFGANVSIGYYDQEQRLLTPHKTVLNEVWDDFPTTNEQDIRSLLGSFLFSGDDVLKPISTLSGGERARVLLSKLALRHDNFLILDEPTNHLDLDSKEVLENALIHFDGTILFVSHDRYFINRVATAIVELSEMGTTLYSGDYDYYLEKKAEALDTNITLPIEVTPPQKTTYAQSKDMQRQKRQIERTIERLEKELSELEKNTNEKTALLNTIMSDYAQAYAIQQDIDKNSVAYDVLLEQWEEANLQLEQFGE